MQIIARLTQAVVAFSKRITATDTSAAIDLSKYTGEVLFTLNSSAPEGAAQTSDVKLTHCDTSGGTYTDSGIAFDQVTTAGGASFQSKLRNVDGLKQFVKVVNTLGGASPAITYGVTITGKTGA
jgi:hypothetical protein